MPFDPDRITVTDDHPLFPGRSGKITQLPNPDAAIVEFDTGERELINLSYLAPAIAPAIAQHLKLEVGALVEIDAPTYSKINGRKGRIAAVGEYTVDVWIRDVNTMTMHEYTLKHQQFLPVPLEKEPQLLEVCERLTKLRSCNLDPFEVEILNLLDRPVAFTPIELDYLTHIEQRHKAKASCSD